MSLHRLLRKNNGDSVEARQVMPYEGNNGDSVEAGQAMPLGRVPASPAITDADNSKPRATISEDRAALIAPPVSFMAGEEQTSGSEVNHIIAGIRNKYFRERTGKLKQIQEVFNGL